jgi:hypothetical protein
MPELTPEGLRDMLAPEFEAVTGRILDSESRLRAEMTRRFDRVDVRFDELRSELTGEIGGLRTELKGEIGGLRTEIGDIKGEIRELKGLIVTNVKRRKR